MIKRLLKRYKLIIRIEAWIKHYNVNWLLFVMISWILP